MYRNENTEVLLAIATTYHNFYGNVAHLRDQQGGTSCGLEKTLQKQVRTYLLLEMRFGSSSVLIYPMFELTRPTLLPEVDAHT